MNDSNDGIGHIVVSDVIQVISFVTKNVLNWSLSGNTSSIKCYILGLRQELDSRFLKLIVRFTFICAKIRATLAGLPHR